MALNASGPISLGGATSGESINLELGLSGTAQISLNDSVVRTLLGVASGAISLNDAYGKSSAAYFMALKTSNRATTFGSNYGLVDSSGNIYMVYDNGFSASIYLLSLTSAGATTLHKSNGTHAYYGSFSPTSFDASGNVVLFNIRDVASFATNLNINFWKYFTPTDSGSNYNGLITSAVKDSAGNIYATRGFDFSYCGGFCNTYYASEEWLYKFNSALTSLTVRHFYRGVPSNYSFAPVGQISVDSSDNIYRMLQKEYDTCCGSSNYAPVLQKWNSSMSLATSIGIVYTGFGSGLRGYGRHTVVDSANNIYTTIVSDDASQMAVSKFNSSLTHQWTRLITGSNTAEVNPVGMAKDSSDNIYILSWGAGNGETLTVVKYNSSGTLQWQRKFSLSGGALRASYNSGGGNIIVNSYGVHIFAYAYVGGAGSVYTPFVAKIPLDGSHTGTYTVGTSSITYGTGNFTDSSIGTTYVFASTYTDALYDTTTPALSSFSASSSTTVTHTIGKTTI